MKERWHTPLGWRWRQAPLRRAIVSDWLRFICHLVVWLARHYAVIDGYNTGCHAILPILWLSLRLLPQIGYYWRWLRLDEYHTPSIWHCYDCFRHRHWRRTLSSLRFIMLSLFAIFIRHGYAYIVFHYLRHAYAYAAWDYGMATVCYHLRIYAYYWLLFVIIIDGLSRLLAPSPLMRADITIFVSLRADEIIMAIRLVTPLLRWCATSRQPRRYDYHLFTLRHIDKAMRWCLLLFSHLSFLRWYNRKSAAREYEPQCVRACVRCVRTPTLYQYAFRRIVQRYTI